MLLVVPSATLADVSAGFRKVRVPEWAYENVVWEIDLYALELGLVTDSEWRLTASYAYSREEVERTAWQHRTAFCGGLAGFYPLHSLSAMSLGLGGRIEYSEVYYSSPWQEHNPFTRSWQLSPLLRLDLSLPGLERLGLYTELGASYVSTRMMSETQPPIESGESTSSRWSIRASEDILAGVAWTF